MARYLDALAEGIVAANPPGAERQRALAQCLGTELLDGIIVRRWFDELPEAERAMLLDAATAFTRRWVSPQVFVRLEPAHRIMVHCLQSGDEDDLTDVVRYRAFGTPTRAIVDCGRVFAGLPLFRNPATDIPDACYEISATVGVEHRLSEYSWHGTRMRLSGYAFINHVDTDDQATTVVLRERSSGEEAAVPARLRPSPELSSQFHDGLYEYGYAGFDAVVDLDALPGDRALPDGQWDVLVEVRAHGVERRCRVATLPDGDRDPRVDHHLPDFSRRGAGLVTTYVSHEGQLTLFVETYGGASPDLVQLTCCESSGVGLTLSAYSGISDWPVGTTARLCLVRGDVTRTFPAAMRPCGAGFGLTAHIRASKLLLPPGWWGVGLRLTWEHGSWEVPLHDAEGRPVWLRGRRSAREMLGLVRDVVRA
ncbi:hypothetical protein [Stackebrandtia nassauensis]|uniref:hypothetical protein n=1 Tax=Stackebrandtia nassauensis TaxID=283811 RepID=UPI0001A38E7E|nr:hypothetical protein [Stackebrandtia nassauensis]